MHEVSQVAEVRPSEENRTIVDRMHRIADLQRQITDLRECIAAEKLLLNPKDPARRLVPHTHARIASRVVENQAKLDRLTEELVRLQSEEIVGHTLSHTQRGTASMVSSLVL